MNQKLKSILGFSAFKLGIIICVAFYFGARNYYNIKESGMIKYQDTISFSKLIEDLHQRTIDLKLIARGPKFRDSKVALLAIDEPSVEKFGRWPWSRSIIGEMVDEAFKNEAKVLAFDVIFSEADTNQAVRSLTKLREQTKLSPEQEVFIKKEMHEANSDFRLAEAIERHGDKIIMGTYFDSLAVNLDPYQQTCAAVAYSLTQEGLNLDNESIPVAVLDEVETELPETVLDFMEENFSKIEQQLDSETTFTKKSKRAQALREKHSLYCATWLYDEDPYLADLREIWPEVMEEEEIELDFESWRTQFTKSAVQNQVDLSGRLWMSIDKFSEHTKHTAYFNAFQDQDGTIRKNHLLYRYGSTYMPAMGLKAVMVANNQGLLVNVERNPYDYFLKGVRSMSLTDEEGTPTQSIPVDFEAAIPINYAGPQKMFPYLSVAELLNGKDTVTVDQRNAEGGFDQTVYNKKEFIKDRIFLVGATAIGIYDLRVTPFEENFPGPETHLNIIDNILRGDYLRTTKDEPPYVLAAILLLGFLMSFAISNLGAVSGLFISMGMITGSVLLDFNFLFSQGIVITIVLPLSLFLVLYTSLTFYKYFTEERNKKELKGTFQKYVSPAIVDEILKDPSNIQLGGRKERMTVLFSDIRGFTTISEQLDPQALSDLLNSYLTPMTDLVFENKGTLDKYMGDAVMAFFGAPISYKDHAKMGVKCALEMLEKLEVLQTEYKAQGLPELDVGIGLNTGDMSVGNMGSETVRSYTVMGDAVNLGARLEGINKQYGTRIIISEFTFSDVKEDFICREIDWVKVKGKLEPVKIYEVAGFLSLDENKQNIVTHFNEGFAEYHRQEFPEALASFNKALALDPTDGPSLLYVERTENYLSSPPPQDWDGVFTMTTK